MNTLINLKEKIKIYELEGKQKGKKNTPSTIKNLQMLFAVE